MVDQEVIYTTRWFEEQALPLWEKHILPLKDQIDTYLEIGVAEGQSMRWVLENLEPARAIGIDPYIPSRSEQANVMKMYRENMEKNLATYLDRERSVEAKPQLHLFYQASYEFFTNCGDYPQNNSLDLAYIDGSHWGWDCLADMVHVWPKLRRGSGIMVIDDYHRRMHRQKAMVRPAVNAFRLAYDGRWGVVFEAARQIAFRRLT